MKPMKIRLQLTPVVYLILLRQDQILLMRRFQTGYYDDHYSVCSGHLEGNESLTSAMIREANEEIGLELTPADLKHVHSMHRIQRDTDGSLDERLDFFFVCTLSEDSKLGEPRNVEPEKCDQLLWTDLDSLPEKMIPYVREAIQRYRQGSHYSEYGWSDL